MRNDISQSRDILPILDQDERENHPACPLQQSVMDEVMRSA